MGKWKEAVAVVDTMMECRIRPDVVIYTSLIGCLFKQGKAKQAMKILNSRLDKSSRILKPIFKAWNRGFRQPRPSNSR